MKTSLTLKENYVRSTMPAQNGGEIAILVNTTRGRADKVYTIDSVSQFTRIFGDATSKSAKYALWLLRRGHVLKVVTYPYSNGATKASYQKSTGGETPTILYEVEAVAPGTDYNKVSLDFTIYSTTNFGIKVKYDGTVVEEFENVTLDESSDYYIGEVFNSDFVKFTVLPMQVSDIGSPTATQPINISLTGGSGAQLDSTATLAQKRTATDLFKSKEHMFCVLLLPEESGADAVSVVTGVTGTETALIKREDFELLVDAAKNQGTVTSPNTTSSFVAPYYNRVKEPVLGFVDASLEAADIIGNLHIQKMWWKAPAGVENATLPTAVDLEDELTAENVAAIQEASVNPIIARAGVGLVIWGQATAIVVPTDIQRLSTRLLVNYLKRICYDICLGYMFKDNNEFTWSACKGEILPVLNDIANLGGITEQNVICDRTIMTDEEIEAGKMNVQVEFRPVSQIKTIVVNFSVTENSITVEEV